MSPPASFGVSDRRGRPLVGVGVLDRGCASMDGTAAPTLDRPDLEVLRWHR